LALFTLAVCRSGSFVSQVAAVEDMALAAEAAVRAVLDVVSVKRAD
jgi:hypothetical protein